MCNMRTETRSHAAVGSLALGVNQELHPNRGRSHGMLSEGANSGTMKLSYSVEMRKQVPPVQVLTMKEKVGPVGPSSNHEF